LYQVLRLLKNKDIGSVSFRQLDKMMANAEAAQFTFDTFKAAYDSDPRVKNIVSNFDKDKIDIKDNEVDDLDAPDAGSSDVVGDMAKSAVDLSDL
jgi:hypothetical protein